MKSRTILAAVTLLCLMSCAVTSASAEETLGAKPPEGAVVLLSEDKASTGNWTKKNGSPIGWKFEDGVLTVEGRTGDILTKRNFRDYRMHLEFRTPNMPDARGQARGNSGVYQAGRYELQILDSYGLESKNNDCGAIYQQYAPAVNACKKPMEWQTYDITFRSAKVVDGKVTEKARITVYQNGKLILDDKPIEVTPGGIDMEPGKEGPILLQDHGNAVSFRNIWLKPL